MRRFPPFPLRAVLVVLLAMLAGGCDWLSRPAGDPRREGNYQDGLHWVDLARWDSARDSFYHALEVNPHNLHAHLALGDLYRLHLTNHPLAHFHYSRYLELGQQINHGEFHDQSAEDGRRNAEIELARTYAERLYRDQQTADYGSLRRTNAALAERAVKLGQENSALNDRIVKLTQENALLLQRLGVVPGGPATTPPSNPPAVPRVPIVVPAVPPSNPPPTRVAPPPSSEATGSRSHRVQAGDNLASIARRYGVKLASLQAANPGVNPRNLRVGQTLAIPAR